MLSDVGLATAYPADFRLCHLLAELTLGSSGRALSAITDAIILRSAARNVQHVRHRRPSMNLSPQDITTAFKAGAALAVMIAASTTTACRP